MTCDRLAVATLAVGLLLFSAPWALAQPASTPCAEIPDCADRFREAQRLSKSGAHDQALQGFLDIHRQYGDPTALYPIAVMFDRLSRTAEAVTAYQRYLDAGVETDPERLAKIQEQLRHARALTNPSPSHSKISPEKPSPAPPPDAISRTEPTAPTAQSPVVQLPTQFTAAVAAAAATMTQPAPQRSPIYKKWWFWTVLGGAAAMVAVGTAIGVAAREPDLTNVMQYRPFTQ